MNSKKNVEPVKLAKNIYDFLKFAKEAGYIYIARYEHDVCIIKDLSEFLKK